MRRAVASITLMAAVVLFALAASSARASDARMLDPLARVSPHIVSTNQRTVALYTRPLPLAVNGIEYEMSLVVQQIPGRFAGAANPRQCIHRHRHGDRAGCASGGLHRHPAMSRTACRLPNGATGYVRSTRGTLSYPQFSIDTTTAPFFGVLTSAGTQARLTLDPGCVFNGGTGHKLHQCPGHLEISGSSADGSSGFDAADNYGRTRVFELAAEGTNGSVKSIGHFGFEAGPISDLPRPSRSATGATAHLRTTGGILMAGSATFTSHRAPGRSVVHRCLSYGRVHSFRSYHYRGKLTPDLTPLAALFDTGTFTLAGPVSGDLRVLVYSRVAYHG
jgi:hypothetical protein